MVDVDRLICIGNATEYIAWKIAFAQAKHCWIVSSHPLNVWRVGPVLACALANVLQIYRYGLTLGIQPSEFCVALRPCDLPSASLHKICRQQRIVAEARVVYQHATQGQQRLLQRIQSSIHEILLVLDEIVVAED